MQTDAYYFAYGSNMNPQRVADRGLITHDPRGAMLPGYVLRFDKQSRDHKGFGHANISVEPSAVTEGVIYRLEHASEILKMDPFERAPINYGREAVLVTPRDGGSRVWAWTYFANPAVIADGLRPPPDYLAHLLAGAAFLSSEYLAWLSHFMEPPA